MSSGYTSEQAFVEVTDLDEQLRLINEIYIIWPPKYCHVSRTLTWGEGLAYNNPASKAYEKNYVFDNLHPKLQRRLIERWIEFIRYFEDSLVVYRVLKDNPALIRSIYKPSFNIQKFAFRYASSEIQIGMVKNSMYYNMEGYFESLDFKKEFGYLILSEEMGLFAL